MFLGADFNDPRAFNDPNFDPRAYEDFLEENIVRKIDEFKQKYLEIKDKAEAAEREVALSEIKVEEIIKKARELE